MPRTVNLVGPIEPTGLSWLINCLIELNIKCSNDPDTWDESERKARLRPEQERLRRWLPALSDATRAFDFRSDIEIRWSHDWLSSEHLENQTIFFTREPKTAHFSGYKRLGTASLSFHDYLIEIDSQWLLNRMQIWNLFHGLWSNHPRLKLFHFEDYKRDAIKTLKSVIEFLEISDIEQKDIAHAVEASTFEMAKRSEEKYLKQINKETTPMIRQGSINLEDDESERIAYDLIDSNCLFLYENIKAGVSADYFLKRSELNSQVFAYLERNDLLQKYLPSFEFADQSLSGYRHITRASVEVSRKTSNDSHVLSAIQRSIFRNFIKDLKLLAALRNGRFPISNYSLVISLIRIPLRQVRSKMKTLVSNIRTN